MHYDTVFIFNVVLGVRVCAAAYSTCKYVCRVASVCKPRTANVPGLATSIEFQICNLVRLTMLCASPSSQSSSPNWA